MNRWLGILFVGTCLSVTAIAGCGDDSEDDGEGGSNASGSGQGTVNEAGASAIVSASSSALASLSAGDGPGAALALASVGTSAAGVITPSSGQTQSVPLTDSSFGTARSAACEEQCEGDETSGSCTFSGCTIEGSGYSWGIEGSISWTASTLDCDLGYTGDLQGLTWTVNINCDLDYTSTSLDGAVTSDGSYTGAAGGQNIDLTWDSSVTYNGVTFPEGGGCPTSGSVDVDASVTANGASYDGAGSVTFPVAGCAG